MQNQRGFLQSHKKFKVNNETIIKDKITCWHDDAHIFNKNVKDGEILEIHLNGNIITPQPFHLRGQ